MFPSTWNATRGSRDDVGCDALDPESELHAEAQAEVDACVAVCEDERD